MAHKSGSSIAGVRTILPVCYNIPGGGFVDLRENIIQKVISTLENRATDEVISIVQDILIMELNRYEVQERCTEVAVLDNTPEKMLKKYIATKRIEGVAESTLKRYADQNLKLLNFVKKPLEDITAYDIRFYLSYKRESKKVCNNTLDGIRRCFNGFFGWLAAEGMIRKNPCAVVSQIKCKKQIRLPYSAVEMEKMRKSCRTLRDLALVDFLYSTGCRVSEVARMDISDIDFERLECKVLGKGNKERIVYLTPVAAMNLQEYLEKRKGNSESLFEGWEGKRISKNGIEALIKRIGKNAGVEKAHPHRFRRTLATNLMDRGMNIQDVAMILGHSDLKTTQIYCYVNRNNVRTAFVKYAA